VDGVDTGVPCSRVNFGATPRADVFTSERAASVLAVRFEPMELPPHARVASAMLNLHLDVAHGGNAKVELRVAGIDLGWPWVEGQRHGTAAAQGDSDAHYMARLPDGDLPWPEGGVVGATGANLGGASFPLNGAIHGWLQIPLDPTAVARWLEGNDGVLVVGTAPPGKVVIAAREEDGRAAELVLESCE
jgi:hypothetical protein